MLNILHFIDFVLIDFTSDFSPFLYKRTDSNKFTACQAIILKPSKKKPQSKYEFQSSKLCISIVTFHFEIDSLYVQNCAKLH